MPNRNAILKFMLTRFVRVNRLPSVLPPSIPPAKALGRRKPGSALVILSRSLVAAMVLSVLPLLAGVREVTGIGLTVGDLAKELEFYTNTLPFQLVSLSEESGAQTSALFGLPGVSLKSAELRLGDEHIWLTEHLNSKGRPIPADSRSFDHWFQHIAIVVRDMDKAYEHLRVRKVAYVSTSPQTLPEWNTNAAGIKAFYFRDPERHVLEIIWFPPGKGDSNWQRLAHSPPGESSAMQALFLGIDHTAIVVSDTDRSLAFYRDLLGMRVAGESENYGVEQEHLNQVFGARLRITALRTERGPGIEFLEYVAPPGGRALPQDSKSNDLTFWTTHLNADDLPELTSALQRQSVSLVSASIGTARSLIVRDPDGHGLLLEKEPKTVSQSGHKDQVPALPSN
jgi:catechol 2,3-dioxygenase-like lactoylglutathione lyase family enzyme